MNVATANATGPPETSDHPRAGYFLDLRVKACVMTASRLFRITRNTLAEERRRSTRAPEARPIDESSDGVTADAEEPCWCILAQLQSLKPEYVQILQRGVIEEKSIREVARELGITENNATVRLHRARAACARSCMRTAAPTPRGPAPSAAARSVDVVPGPSSGLARAFTGPSGAPANTPSRPSRAIDTRNDPRL